MKRTNLRISIKDERTSKRATARVFDTVDIQQMASEVEGSILARYWRHIVPNAYKYPAGGDAAYYDPQSESIALARGQAQSRSNGRGIVGTSELCLINLNLGIPWIPSKARLNAAPDKDEFFRLLTLFLKNNPQRSVSLPDYILNDLEYRAMVAKRIKGAKVSQRAGVLQALKIDIDVLPLHQQAQCVESVYANAG